MDQSIKKVKKREKMFLGYVSVLLAILCCVPSAIGDRWFFQDVIDQRWAFWNVNGDELLATEDYVVFGERKPLDRSKANLDVFNAVSVGNFDRQLNVSRLEAKFPNMAMLELRQCDVAIINEAFEGKTMRNIRRLWINSDDGYGGACPSSPEAAPESSTVESFPHLEELRVFRHPFSAIPRFQFVPSFKLKVLRINSAGHERLPRDFFVDSRALEKISLFGNRLESLDADTFAGNVNLIELELTQNQLVELPAQIFQHNVKLRKLVIDQNKIRSLPERLLANQSDLEQFDASNNRLSTIPARFFANNRKLRHVIYEL